jgi:hypothetical protein
MSFWHSCGVVGVPAEASTVVAGLPSAVEAVMFLLSQLAAVASIHAVAGFTVFARIAYILCWQSCCCFHSCCCLRSCCCERS